MKKLSILALSLSATVAVVPAFAETSVNYNIPNITTQPTTLDVVSQVPTTAQADLSFAFDDAENLQALAMTDGEMAETQGAALPPVLVGYGIRAGVMGTIGAGTNAWNHYSTTGRWSWKAAGRGFVGGAMAGVGAKYLTKRGW